MNCIYAINGPVVKVRDTKSFSMREMVMVGKSKLIGEVIGVTDEMTTIQVYEGTAGLMPGDPVEPTGTPMSATLGPGIISNIYDGIQRPLKAMTALSGVYVTEGSAIAALDEEREFDVTVTVKVGDKLHGGDIYAQCPETPLITHRCMVPPYTEGTVEYVAPDGKYKVNDVIVKLRIDEETVQELTLVQKWPIRTPRPINKRLPISKPLITGQRIVDTVLPLAKGGTAAIPGGFGTGKTMTQHQLAKWCDADIIVYIGCGERGNEMTQVLEEFSELIDPKSNRPLTDRTVLIANTSNMPVAAREASIYTGITLAEYYRDMGYHIAIMADSTSRWAEALREISGRLEEMPAEEGFPAYLPSRLSTFYERAGMVDNLNGTKGSISIIGAVSPQGGDFSEPVTQNTKRFIRCFWALDRSLAYQRHYPAINWLTSYSEYSDDLKDWFDQNVSEDFGSVVLQIKKILTEESSLMEIVKLIGSDVLPDSQRLVLEVAKIVRLGFLQQNAFNPTDTYVPLKKQYLMLKTCLTYYEEAKKLIAMGVPISQIHQTGLTEKLVSIKYDVKNDDFAAFDRYADEIKTEFDKIGARYAPKKAVQ